MLIAQLAVMAVMTAVRAVRLVGTFDRTTAGRIGILSYPAPVSRPTESRFQRRIAGQSFSGDY
jgi:hypothetical protein